MQDGNGRSSWRARRSCTVQPGFERGQMVFFEGVKWFELEDLLRASTEMLGKLRWVRDAYKAVLDDGNVVAVKRLKDASVRGKREFEQHMELLGRLQHMKEEEEEKRRKREGVRREEREREKK
ncbi:hypothetical protein SLA2020_495300 [Shorea laevis]